MSRTYRCKHYEVETNDSYSRYGKKIAGPYAVRMGNSVTRLSNGRWACLEPVAVREPTPEEYFRKWYRAHGESRHRDARSPSREYRVYRMRQNRRIAIRELQKYMLDTEYEPMVDREPRNCWWDWD